MSTSMNAREGAFPLSSGKSPVDGNEMVLDETKRANKLIISLLVKRYLNSATLK